MRIPVTPAQRQQTSASSSASFNRSRCCRRVGNPLRGRAKWTLGDAHALLGLIEGIGSEGLDPADYDLAALARCNRARVKGRSSIAAASHSFSWLIEDLRDGRTPMEARKQWFVVDPDPDAMPTGK